MIYKIGHKTTLNDVPLYVLVNDAIYNSGATHYDGSAYTTQSGVDMFNYIADWLLVNLGDSAAESLRFPWPVNQPSEQIAYEQLAKIFNFYHAAPVAESGTTIPSTLYVGVNLPSITVAQYGLDSSRITAAEAGPILGYVQSWLTPTGSFQGYFPVFPSTVIHDGKWDFSGFTTSDHIGLLFFSVAYNNGSYTLSSYDINYQHFAAARTDIANLQAWNNITTDAYVISDDPYTGAGYPASTAPGGMSGGSFDFTDEGLTGVHTPGLDLLNSGLITVWRPSKATLAQLASWLWVTTPGQVIQQLFGNPINAIIGLNIVPVSPPVDGGTNTIHFGNEDSHVACPMVTSQHVTVDCGSLTIAPIYGSYMDYAPNTSAELYLPYVGGLAIDVNDVIGKTLSITYQVDVLSGACVAYVHVDGKLHYQRSGSCAATAPITGSQMPNVISGVLSIIGSVAGAIASMGGSGAGTAAKVASGISTGTSVASSTANMLKQSISYSGTIAGWAGLLGAQKPYLVLSVPNAAIPAGQAGLMGYPAWVGGRLGDFHGRTSCAASHLAIPTATDEEIEEIKGLLETGVFLP